MKTEDIKLGDTLVMFNGQCHYRVVQITSKYFLLDDPEGRAYFTNGKLTPMSFKKLYFNTRHRSWNLENIEGIDNSYDFKLKKFNQCIVYVNKKDIQANYLPTIAESLKLKRPYDI